METTPAKPKFSFESQASDEDLILLLRAHIITNVPWIILAIIFILIPPLVAFSNSLDPLISSFNLPLSALTGVVLLWYLFVFAYILQNFLSWYFNVYLVTSERIVDMDFFQLLYRKISSADLLKIEDITFTTGGVAQVIFNYGDIHIQTAGEKEEFEFLKVPNPGAVQKVIEEAARGKRNAN